MVDYVEKDAKTIENYTLDIIHKVTETRDDFIFQTVLKSFELTDKLPDLIISKELLRRAIACFSVEHKEEFEKLREESYKRNGYGICD